jgi:FMN reductase
VKERNMSEIIGFSGSYSRPSKTRALVEAATLKAAQSTGLPHDVFDIGDLGPSLGAAQSLADLDQTGRALIDRLINAQAIVVGSPVYKGSYTGLFKHVFDLIDPGALHGKPVLLTATGGGDKHALVIEHQLRPLFGFFEAATVPTGIYANAAYFDGSEAVGQSVGARIDTAVAQLAAAVAVTNHRKPKAANAA